MKVNKETIKKIAIGTGKIFVYGSLALLSAMKINDETKNIHYDDFVDCEGYNDAVDSIINSDMSDYYKHRAISMVKRNMDTQYYKAVATIAKGDASDYYKTTMIEHLYADEVQAK